MEIKKEKNQKIKERKEKREEKRDDGKLMIMLRGKRKRMKEKINK